MVVKTATPVRRINALDNEMARISATIAWILGDNVCTSRNDVRMKCTSYKSDVSQKIYVIYNTQHLLTCSASGPLKRSGNRILRLACVTEDVADTPRMVPICRANWINMNTNVISDTQDA